MIELLTRLPVTLPCTPLTLLSQTLSLSPQPSVGVASVTPRVIATSVEHPAILAYLKHLQTQGSIALDIVGVSAEVTGDIGPIAGSDAF